MLHDPNSNLTIGYACVWLLSLEQHEPEPLSTVKQLSTTWSENHRSRRSQPGNLSLAACQKVHKTSRRPLGTSHDHSEFTEARKHCSPSGSWLSESRWPPAIALVASTPRAVYSARRLHLLVAVAAEARTMRGVVMPPWCAPS